ncbi:MAG: LysR substrate-binding domain-containing protein [bacterium]|nr:LysR substrate-binding domain-containing protein [bacterium]
MEFHQLRYFVAAAETASMSAAARREHVSQPALSRQVAQLERTLGVPLFERKKQRIHLTPAGKFFLPRARQLLCDAELGAQQLREEFGGARRTLRLGYLSPFLDDLVAPTVRQLKRDHRSLKVAMFDLPPGAQLDRLGARELDAAILGNLEPEHSQRFTARQLSRHRFAAALPADHPLADRRRIPLAALRGETWVSLDDLAFPGRRAFLQAVCNDAGFEPAIGAEVDSVTTMLGTVAAGDDVALVPHHSSKLPHDGVVFVRLESPAPTAELRFVTRRREPMAELDSLYRLLRERARVVGDA